MIIVMEIQKDATVTTVVTTHETRNDAENKYHTILAYAAVSSVPQHSAVMLNDNGSYIKSETFEHEVE